MIHFLLIKFTPVFLYNEVIYVHILVYLLRKLPHFFLYFPRYFKIFQNKTPGSLIRAVLCDMTLCEITNALCDWNHMRVWFFVGSYTLRVSHMWCVSDNGLNWTVGLNTNTSANIFLKPFFWSHSFSSKQFLKNNSDTQFASPFYMTVPIYILTQEAFSFYEYFFLFLFYITSEFGWSVEMVLWTLKK